MKRPFFTLAAVLSFGVFAVCGFIAVRTVYAANRCCQNVTPYAPCSGCLQIAPGAYVNAGPRSVKKCEQTTQSSSCSEIPKVCLSLVNVDVYSDNGCTNKVGLISVTKFADQCDDFSDACGGG